MSAPPTLMPANEIFPRSHLKSSLSMPFESLPVKEQSIAQKDRGYAAQMSRTAMAKRPNTNISPDIGGAPDLRRRRPQRAGVAVSAGRFFATNRPYLWLDHA
jgi:hypothetical protein